MRSHILCNRWLWKSCRKNVWIVVQLLCLALVIIQTVLSVSESFFSGKTVTTSTVGKLKDVVFPVILNLIVTPGFSRAKLHQFGFKDVYKYFKGRNMGNKSLVGWASYDQGHSFHNASG